MALLEAVKEVIFMIQVLGSRNVSVRLLLTVIVDNVGTIFMAENVIATSCT